MKLKLYLDIRGKSMTEFAQETGLTLSYISRIIAGNRRPSPQVAAQIEKATKGKVSRLELLYP